MFKRIERSFVFRKLEELERRRSEKLVSRQMDSPEREIYRDPDVVRADDRVNEVVHTDTARKMLSIFRQMEENACKKELPNGPKPLKRFTPPPEDKYAKATASDSEEDEDEDGEESEGEDSGEERDPNYVRASDKVSTRTYTLATRLIVLGRNKWCRLLTSSRGILEIPPAVMNMHNENCREDCSSEPMATRICR